MDATEWVCIQDGAEGPQLTSGLFRPALLKAFLGNINPDLSFSKFDRSHVFTESFFCRISQYVWLVPSVICVPFVIHLINNKIMRNRHVRRTSNPAHCDICEHFLYAPIMAFFSLLFSEPGTSAWKHRMIDFGRLNPGRRHFSSRKSTSYCEAEVLCHSSWFLSRLAVHFVFPSDTRSEAEKQCNLISRTIMKDC